MPSAPGQHVALFLPSLRAGGAEHVMLELAGGFVERGLRTDLVLAQVAGEYVGRVASGVRVVDLGALRTVGALPGLVSYLRRERPDALLSTMNHVNVIAITAARLARAGTRVVVREATTPTEAMANARGLRPSVVLAGMAATYPFADAVVALCEAAADGTAASARIPRSRIQVIGNPVDVGALERRAAEPSGHPWLDRPDGVPCALGVGRLSEEKDFAVLIRAFCRVLARRPARLIIAGEGMERPRLEGLVRALGIEHAVSLRGFVQNPAAYLSRASVFALASWWEGLPNVLLHALALGVPAVATDCAGGSAEVLGYGRRGTLVPVRDERAMAAALLDAFDRPRTRHAEYVRSAYSREAVLDQYVALLRGPEAAAA